MVEKTLHLAITPTGVGELVLDCPGEKVNKLGFALMGELDALLDSLKGNREIRLLVIKSAKPGVFIAGADIQELARISHAAAGAEKSKLGQDVFNKLAALPFPTLAAINGACLGGGMELALACSFRMAGDHPKTQLGLPEVKLGILPGWGGTQRLPRLVGLASALDLILSGRSLDAIKAFKMGLVDAVAANEFFEERVLEFAAALLDAGQRSEVQKRRRRKGLLPFLLEGNPLGRSLLFKHARKDVLEKTKGQYPAPLAVLDLIRGSWSKPLPTGLGEEAKAFGALAATPICKNLIQVFFAGEALKKAAAVEGITPMAVPVRRAGVLGAGVMGGGIAWLLSSSGLRARMKDLNWDALAKGFQAAAHIYGDLAKKRRLKPTEMSLKMHAITGTLDFSGFHDADAVFEAIVENLEVKKKVLAEAEAAIPPGALLLTNTSALSVAAMGEVLRFPERFLGFHFFNPVHRMPLVEIIPGPKTSKAALAAALDLAKALGKSPVVVRECAGFLVNRILLPYLNEAAYVLEDGFPMEDLDRKIEAFGMPMGPFVLADEVGIDVGVKVAKILEEAYGERMKVAATLHILAEEKKLLGKKGGTGFYLHKGRQRLPNPEIPACALAGIKRAGRAPRIVSAQEAVDRCILIMVNEAARCLGEGIVARADLLDMAMIMGTGFPPFRGGLLRYADDYGLPSLLERLRRLATDIGPRFEPAPLLAEMEHGGRRFYS